MGKVAYEDRDGVGARIKRMNFRNISQSYFFLFFFGCLFLF